MPSHTKLTIARVVQHLLRYPASLSHRSLQKPFSACWKSGYAAGYRAGYRQGAQDEYE